MKATAITFKPAGPFRYRIPRESRKDMRTDGLMFLSPALVAKLETDQSPVQVANVATLPGSSAAAWRCPICTGATVFPSAAWPPSTATTGVISPGGVGYDINCGVNLTRTAFAWTK